MTGATTKHDWGHKYTTRATNTRLGPPLYITEATNTHDWDHNYTGQEATSTHKPVNKCLENISEAGYKCMCLYARSIVNKKTN